MIWRREDFVLSKMVHSIFPIIIYFYFYFELRSSVRLNYLKLSNQPRIHSFIRVLHMQNYIPIYHRCS